MKIQNPFPGPHPAVIPNLFDLNKDRIMHKHESVYTN